MPCCLGKTSSGVTPPRPPPYQGGEQEDLASPDQGGGQEKICSYQGEVAKQLGSL
jgi:hypothetical protein